MLELFAVKNFPPQERKFFAPESEKVVELSLAVRNYLCSIHMYTVTRRVDAVTQRHFGRN